MSRFRISILGVIALLILTIISCQNDRENGPRVPLGIGPDKFGWGSGSEGYVDDSCPEGHVCHNRDADGGCTNSWPYKTFCVEPFMATPTPTPEVRKRKPSAGATPPPLFPGSGSLSDSIQGQDKADVPLGRAYQFEFDCDPKTQVFMFDGCVDLPPVHTEPQGVWKI